MRQRIPLTDVNREILIERYSVDPEHLTREYWVKQIMSDETTLTKLITQPHGSSDLQRRINNRAGKMLKRYIREVLGLPKPSGNMRRQREYARILKTTGLQLPIAALTVIKTTRKELK